MRNLPNSASSGGPELSACYEAIVDLLERLGGGWALAGAFAAMTYRARERRTTDLDFLVEWNPGLLSGLVERGFDVRSVNGEEPHLLRTRRHDGVADLIVAQTAYQHLAIERAGATHVLTVEDVLVHKLIAWRARDRDDIVSILSTGLAFDEAYVDHWAAEWEVSDRWREARAW